jgi:hypothetical protein
VPRTMTTYREVHEHSHSTRWKCREKRKKWRFSEDPHPPFTESGCYNSLIRYRHSTTDFNTTPTGGGTASRHAARTAARFLWAAWAMGYGLWATPGM